MRPVQLRARVGDADPLHHLVEVAVVVRTVEPLEPVLAGPLLAHPGERPQAVLPVDDRSATQGGTGLDRDLALRGRHRAAAQVEVLIAPDLELVEIGLVEVAPQLQYADLLAEPGEGPGDHATAGARANDADVGLERHRPGAGLGSANREGLRLVGGRALRPRIAHRVPARVAPRAQVGKRVEDRQRQPPQGIDPGERLRARVGEGVDELLARLLRGLGSHPARGQRVEQRRESGQLFGGRAGLQERDLDGFGHPEVRRCPGPEALREGGLGAVGPLRRLGRRQRGDQRVAEGEQRAALRIGEQLAGRQQADRLANLLSHRGRVREHVELP